MILSLLFSLGGPLGWGLLGVWAQAPSTRLSDLQSSRLPGVWRAEAEDTGKDPVGRNWCPYPMSKLVTLLALCKTEKFLVHSQQPCPQGAPECQRVKVMYRMAHKPVYQVKQKVLTSLAWRCCPGYTGPNCEHHDSMAIPEPADPSDSHQEPGDGPVSFEPGHLAAAISEVEVQQEQQEHLLGDLQNDVHQVADSLPGLWKALPGNLTAAMMEANQTEHEFPDRSLEQVLLPHVDTFLQVHFSPIWRSFNQSLHSLSQAIRNLSLNVEANRQAISRVQDSAVAKADFQELGAKFEAKVQENAQRVGQLQQDVEDRLHAQHFTLHRSISELQADVDTKLKRLHKAQEAPGTNGSLVLATPQAGARPEPESLQARLGQLQRNLSELHMTTARREEEFQYTLEDMRATLTRHADEIKELYSESDETFDQISKVERQVEELQVNHTALRELRVILMEKSLIMEENKEEVERQLLELNLTLQHLQGGHADLIKYVKDCNCQKLYLDLDVIREGQRDATRALEETQVSLDERRQLDGSSLQALQRLSNDVKRVGRCCEAEAGAASLNASLDGLHDALFATQRSLEQHQRLFHSLFGNFQGLMEANVSLDLGKLQTMLSRKGKKQQKGLEAPRKRDKKEAEPLVDTRGTGPVPGALGAALWETGSPVAFYASFSEGTAALQTVKFNSTHINVGSSYFPEHGYFRAPERGVYLFAVSVEFGPGPGTGQLVFGGHHRTPVCTTGQGGGSTATVFAMAELQKGERVWFELTQGSITKRSLPGTAFGGFLMFKT
ncbi:PREDICTED: multimerin-2 [Mandrillus leucophaeus]|uniref:multimerin-2 n=1 Tax=Mandrillus leucophaeus TaxID=9568 RepID=UPI0005F46F51|nr:PREDICTED: multimerin-2 [Mandrillus leucophaeus]